MKTTCVIFAILSVVAITSCAGQYYCGSNLHQVYLRFGIHSIAFNVQGCWSASYIRSTCDISFHNSEATIASIPLTNRRKRQALFGGSIANFVTSLFSGTHLDQSGLSYPFTINQYVESLPKNSYLYAIMTDARYANEGIPFCETRLIAPLWRHHAALGGRQDIWYYYRRDGSRILIAFNKECPYACLTN
ncbi:unnamed protein product [Chironomus riparius]|uniref:Uncharacterized protein n=1 Tax=Chironomus riparius TaxID=315576 RepID=A0A9N9RYC6_9DIPT|nr:unnamed protein product [Chironomus riparius]